MPGRNEQQDAEQNRLWGKKQRDLAVGERKRPGDLGGDVIAGGARQDEARCAERCPSGLTRAAASRTLPVAETITEELF